MRNKSKKAADSLSTTLLVFMALSLVLLTLYMFNKDVRAYSTKVENSKLIDSAYLKENELDFYINNILEKSILNISSQSKDIKKDFIDNLKKELYKHKVDGSFIIEELFLIEPQLIEDNIELKQGKIFLKLNLKIDKTLFTKEKKELLISYSYNKIYGYDFIVKS
ncbi:MAG: hypothetical protein Q8N99_04115 [Nanoarchaeota archaeon]|nr:hypothetical protein [Nanoarchaeota archaeon]